MHDTTLTSTIKFTLVNNCALEKHLQLYYLARGLALGFCRSVGFKLFDLRRDLTTL
jgi:hypothetical protein